MSGVDTYLRVITAQTIAYRMDATTLTFSAGGWTPALYWSRLWAEAGERQIHPRKPPCVNILEEERRRQWNTGNWDTRG